MKAKGKVQLLIAAVLLLGACTDSLDPLSPGSMDGQYALGMKSLVPLSVGNTWTYTAVLYDTAGAVRKRYSFTVTILDTVTADTASIPVIPPSINNSSIKRAALLWYLVEGENGTTSCWQVDTVEQFRIRSSNDARFYEQSAFNFRAAVGDTNASRFKSTDTLRWASGDTVIIAADSVRTTLVSKGADTLRTTLGSAQYFYYREFSQGSSSYTNYYFKPGFGLILAETFRRTAGGTMVRIRRDELSSYYFK
jgi:hypothetical protein